MAARAEFVFNSVMITNDVRIFLSTWQSRAEQIPFRPVSIGDWHPEIGRCHSNVDTWVNSNPDHQVVRGWITWHQIIGGMRFTKHSVVKSPEGDLFDITPISDTRIQEWVRFMAHPENHESYAALDPHVSSIVTASPSAPYS